MYSESTEPLAGRLGGNAQRGHHGGKPAFRNSRESDGNGGIIRSPLRAIALPDYRKGAANPSWPRVLQATSRGVA